MQQMLPGKKTDRQTVHQGSEESNDEDTEQAKLGGRFLNKSVGQAGGQARQAGRRAGGQVRQAGRQAGRQGR